LRLVLDESYNILIALKDKTKLPDLYLRRSHFDLTTLSVTTYILTTSSMIPLVNLNYAEELTTDSRLILKNKIRLEAVEAPESGGGRGVQNFAGYEYAGNRLNDGPRDTSFRT
jgi:hypothetical protein